MGKRLLASAVVIATATMLAPGISTAAGSGAGITTTLAQALEQRRMDLTLWNSPARTGLTASAEMLLAMRLGRWSPPSGTPAAVPSAWTAPTDATGQNVRVNDAQADLTSPCTTQSETTIRAVSDTQLAAVFNDSGGGCFYLDSYTGYAYSTDGGSTWTDGGAIEPPEGGFSGGDPSLALAGDGTLYLASLENAPASDPVRPGSQLLAGRSYIGVRRSTDGGKTWSAPADGTAGLLGDHDKELLAVDDSGGPNDGTVYLVWTDFGAGSGRGVITFSRSTDHGATWSEPIRLSRNNNDYDQGAVPAIGPNGEIYVSWQTQLTQTPGIWLTTSLDGGQTFSLPRKIRTIRAPGHTLGCGRDGMNGEIRMLAWPVMAVDTTPVTDPLNPPPYRGTIYIAYATKIGVDEGDINLIRSTDGGVTWSLTPVRVNDDATTLDQFQPGIAAKPNGEVAVFWYDRRRDTGNVNIDVFAGRSPDGGQTWSPNVRINSVQFEGIGNDSTRDPGVASCYMGDYMQLTPVSDGYAALWGDNRDRYPIPGDPLGRSDPNVYFSRFAFPVS